MSVHRPCEPTLRQLVTADGDELIAGAPGVSGQLIRTGRGQGGAALTAVDFGTAHLSVVDVGFPVAGEGVNPDGRVSLFTVLDGPSWVNPDGVVLGPGSTVLYPPGAYRHARDPAGVRSAGTVLPLSVFEASAHALGYDVDFRSRPTVFRGGAIWACVRHLAAMDHVDGTLVAAAREIEPESLIGSVVAAVVDDRGERSSTRRRWDDGDLVHATLAYLDGSDRSIVPMPTLCRHVGVSERRLQVAFKNRFGVGPNSFMRHRALQMSHRRLRHADPATSSVTEVARASGFWHLGRYTGYYKSVYGELPSTTLQRSDSG